MNWQRILATTLFLATAVGAWFWCGQDEPRRAALGTLAQFHAALDSSIDRQFCLLDCVSPPSVIAGRTPVEHADFLHKTLHKERSADGLRLLKQHGHIGPLQKLVTAEAASRTGQAGVKPEDCVAFCLERDTITAEVVLVRAGDTFRVVRCNNVKQLARNQ